MPKTDISKTLIQQAVLQLNSVCECLSALSSQMIQIAQRLPEYSLVHSLYCVLLVSLLLKSVMSDVSQKRIL